MKHLLLPATLLLITAPALAQYQPPPPTTKELQQSGAEAAQTFKGANVIILRSGDSDSAMLRRAASIAQQRGFVIERIDYGLMSFNTKSKPYANSALHTMAISAVVVDKTLQLRGAWHAQMGGLVVDEQAQNTNRAARLAFAEIEAVVAAYPSGRVTYKQQR